MSKGNSKKRNTAKSPNLMNDDEVDEESEEQEERERN